MTVFKEYRDEINRIFSRYTRGGFVDYYHCRGLGHDMILHVKIKRERPGKRPLVTINFGNC
ncbi:hypothetical protein [Hornefia butyriciproducens]|uniref:hypothetical protein n=1 Tax=Hornefia butyriciproducens TaxID=2652293 RepID=UPI003F8B2F7A